MAYAFGELPGGALWTIGSRAGEDVLEALGPVRRLLQGFCDEEQYWERRGREALRSGSWRRCSLIYPGLGCPAGVSDLPARWGRVWPIYLVLSSCLLCSPVASHPKPPVLQALFQQPCTCGALCQGSRPLRTEMPSCSIHSGLGGTGRAGHMDRHHPCGQPCRLDRWLLHNNQHTASSHPHRFAFNLCSTWQQVC